MDRKHERTDLERPKEVNLAEKNKPGRTVFTTKQMELADCGWLVNRPLLRRSKTLPGFFQDSSKAANRRLLVWILSCGHLLSFLFSFSPYCLFVLPLHILFLLPLLTLFLSLESLAHSADIRNCLFYRASRHLGAFIVSLKLSLH